MKNPDSKIKKIGFKTQEREFFIKNFPDGCNMKKYRIEKKKYSIIKDYEKKIGHELRAQENIRHLVENERNRDPQKKRKPQANILSKEVSDFFNNHQGYPKKTQINKLRKENKEEDQEFLMWIANLLCSTNISN